jgi:hypothetical protein
LEPKASAANVKEHALTLSRELYNNNLLQQVTGLALRNISKNGKMRPLA